MVLASQTLLSRRTVHNCIRIKSHTLSIFLALVLSVGLAPAFGQAAIADNAAPSSATFSLPDAPDAGTQAQAAATTQTPSPQGQPALSFPAPVATIPAKKEKANKPLSQCDVQNTAATVINTGAVRALAVSGLHAAPQAAGEQAVGTTVCVDHNRMINWYARFTTGPDVKPMTVSENARLAVVNLTDPFNFLTIMGESAISIALNSHTAYGPGFKGWGESVGVSFTQDMTGQFFGTFLIPAVTHTDPHYHRRPDLSIPRRIWHCVYQIAWQRADNRKEALNYSQLVSPVIEIAFSNLYVPAQETHFSADAERYFTGLATAPVDNFITEFVPSVAARIHTHVILLQKIINHVAASGPGT